MNDATVRMGYSDADLQAGLAKSQSHVAKFVSSTQGRFASIAGGLRNSLGGGLGFLGVGVGVAGVKALFDQFDRVGDLAQQLDQPAEEIQKIGFMASQSGSDVETVVRALNKLNKEAGTLKGQEAFKELNIDAAKFKQLGASEQIIELSEAFQEAERSGKGLKQAYDLMGKGAADLLPLLRSSREELKKHAAQEVVSEEQIRQIQEAGDKLDQIGTSLKNNTVAGAGEWIDRIGEGFQNLRDLFEGDEWGTGFARELSESGKAAGDQAIKDAEARKQKLKRERMDEINEARKALEEQRKLTEEQGMNTAEKRNRAGLDLADINDQIDAARGKGDEVEMLKLQAEREKILRNLNALEKQHTAEADKLLEKQREIRDIEVEMETARLRGDGRDKEADALEKKAALMKQAEQLAKRTGMTEAEALKLVEQRAQNEEKAEQRKHGRSGKIKGYSQDQRGGSKYNNPHRGLDELERMNSGGTGRLFDDHLKTPGLTHHRNLQQRDANGGRLVSVGRAFERAKGEDKAKDEASRKLDAIEKNTRDMVLALQDGE